MSFEEITKRYKKDGFKRLSWQDYQDILDGLVKKIQGYVEENNLKINMVVPILRGGAFPGTYLAYKLHLIRIVPVQYKYFFEDGEIELRKLLGLPKDLSISDNPVILLVENNHCFGLTAETVAKDIKEQFPNAKIIYAADLMDYSYQKNKYADVIFYGQLNNDTKVLTQQEAKGKGFEASSSMFPWEEEKEEWDTVAAKQFDYQDSQRAREVSEFKVELKEE